MLSREVNGCALLSLRRRMITGPELRSRLSWCEADVRRRASLLAAPREMRRIKPGPLREDANGSLDGSHGTAVSSGDSSNSDGMPLTEPKRLRGLSTGPRSGVPAGLDVLDMEARGPVVISDEERVAEGGAAITVVAEFKEEEVDESGRVVREEQGWPSPW